MDKISIVVSCLNEEDSIPLFYKEIKKVSNSMKNVTFEIIFVDDGSTDNTLSIIKSLRDEDKSVRYISFSRNFGKEAAMYAGLKASTGDYVTVMDADLQDPPKLIPKMYEYLTKEDYDIVGTRRVTRKGEPVIRSMFARLFYKIINSMSDIEMVSGARDFRLMKRYVVDSILSMKEYNRYSKGLFSFVGFKTKWLEYDNIKRVAGKTKWSFIKLFKYAIEGILSFTIKPLELPLFIGFIMELITIIMFIINIINKFNISLFYNISLLILFISGLLFICLGIISLYIAKDYLEDKNRPIYIIKEMDGKYEKK